MADKNISETIENLRKSGVSDNEIKSMLQDIGFDKAGIAEALGLDKENAEKKEAEGEETEIEVQEEEYKEEDFLEDSKKHAASAKLASNLAMNVSQATAEHVDRHLEKVKNVENKIDRLYDNFEQGAKKEHIDELKSFHTDLAEKNEDISQRIEDIDAKMDVLTKLMQKILESQREIILKLK